jgi:hypothetical protein
MGHGQMVGFHCLLTQDEALRESPVSVLLLPTGLADIASV